MNVIEKNILNGQSALSKRERAFLIFSRDELVPCTLAETEDNFTLRFNIDGLYSAEDIKTEDLVSKLQFLANCADLYLLREEYQFSLSSENIYYTYNLAPKVLMRDKQQSMEEDFIKEYKAFIAYIIAPKYSYENYLNGGEKLYKRNKTVKSIVQNETVDEIKNQILDLFEKKKQENKSTKQLVRKTTVKSFAIFMPLVVLFLVASLGLSGFLYFMELPYKTTLLGGNSAYLNEDYIGVQEELLSLSMNRLPKETKFILAKSYVITESLTTAQKNNILLGISLKSDEMILDYWISIGRLDFDGAVDIAQRLGDNDLLLFAYIKQKAILVDDTSVDGAEKTVKMKDLDDKIKAITEDLEKSQEEISKIEVQQIPSSEEEDSDGEGEVTEADSEN